MRDVRLRFLGVGLLLCARFDDTDGGTPEQKYDGLGGDDVDPEKMRSARRSLSAATSTLITTLAQLKQSSRFFLSSGEEITGDERICFLRTDATSGGLPTFVDRCTPVIRDSSSWPATRWPVRELEYSVLDLAAGFTSTGGAAVNNLGDMGPNNGLGNMGANNGLYSFPSRPELYAAHPNFIMLERVTSPRA